MTRRLKAKGIGWGVCFLLVVFFSSYFTFSHLPDASGAEANKLKMASVNAFSGKAAAWGFSQDRGIKMAAEKINKAGGIKIEKETYQWEIRSYDNRYIPAEAVSSLKRAIADGCTYMATLGGAVTFPLIPMINSSKIITLAAIAGGSDFTNANNPYLFRTMPSSDLLLSIEAMNLYKKLGIKRLATLMADNVLGRSDGKTLKGALKTQNFPEMLVAEEYVAIDTSDFTPVLTRVLAKNPDLIEGGGWPAASLGTLIKQARELGYKGQISNMTGAVEMKALVETGGLQYTDGLFLARLWPPDQLPTNEFQTFWKDYETQFKEAPGANCWEGYVAFEFLSAGVQKAQSLNPDKVVEAMRNLKIKTMMGELQLIGKDNPLLPGYGINNQFNTPMPITRVSGGKPVIFKVK
jgi:branched-chain amino acid transport system substrate-binding protein